MESGKKLDKKSIGKFGEDTASKYLASNGYLLLEKNYRCGRMGEIDIIASEREYICFIEVKTRSGNLFGAPCEAVGRRKQENMKKIAWIYMKNYNHVGRDMRFDIVEIVYSKASDIFAVKSINLIRNAF